MSLTPELLDLMQYERTIEDGIRTFVEVGEALLAIRDGKKYRAAGFSSFDAYCRERWSMSRRHADRAIAAADVVDKVRPFGLTPPESVARELAPLRDDPETMRAVWDDVSAGGTPTAAETREAVARITKPDLGGGVSHPARFSDALLATFARWLPEREYEGVLDPFAGTGRIHELPNATLGIEIEPEWAALDPATMVGDCVEIMRSWTDPLPFDAVCTSPAYGNRLADHHNASDPERRRSYTHDLGRTLDPANSGGLHWGDDYRKLHVEAWREAVRILRPGGRFVLNIKDHVRDGEVQPVTLWHVATLVECGLSYTAAEVVDARNLRQGTNADLRCPEWVIVLDKPR